MGFASACMQFEVNTLGPLRTVTALSASLSPGAKVALIGSKMGSIAATRQGGKSGSAGYRCVRGVGEEHAGVRVRCSQVVVVGVGGKEANEERFPGFLLACACACTEGWGRDEWRCQHGMHVIALVGAAWVPLPSWVGPL